LSVEHAYRYGFESTLDGADLTLATSGGPSAFPYFFDGFVERAEVFAAALLVVARVARTRFYTPPGTVAAILRAADPIVTSNGDRLRFESFSACCGVYCRLDALPDALDRPPRATGTTNVDFNPPMRDALAGVGGLDPMRLAVGVDEVRVTTLDATAVERRVPLPTRWIKSLAEVQVASAAMTPKARFSGVELRRFLQSVPRGAQRGALFAVPAQRGLRLATRPSAGAVGIAGVERLRVVEPVLRHASTVHAYGPDPGADPASAWQLDLPGVRLTVALSPAVSRGFSGEGGALHDLADPTAGLDAELIGTLLVPRLGAVGEPHAPGFGVGPAVGEPHAPGFGGAPTINVSRLAGEAELTEASVRRALTHLAAAGRVGFDLAEGAYFQRELPYDPAALRARHPRLRDAIALVEGGHTTVEAGETRVRSGDTTHVVRHTPGGDRCTCTWHATHGSGRGPCKHILAARLAAQPAVDTGSQRPDDMAR
jgi:hypothetical protein